MDESGHKHLFIGIAVDEHCQQQIDRALQTLQQTRDDIRWVTAQNRHLTLAYLGDSSAEKTQTLLQHLDTAYQDIQPFTFSINVLCRFPDPRGRIVAATNAPSVALSSLQKKTLALLQRCDITVETMPFRPHITLGKIQNARHVHEDFRQPLDLSLAVRAVNLYESAPQGEGRVYAVLAQIHF